MHPMKCSILECKVCRYLAGPLIESLKNIKCSTVISQLNVVKSICQPRNNQFSSEFWSQNLISAQFFFLLTIRTILMALCGENSVFVYLFIYSTYSHFQGELRM